MAEAASADHSRDAVESARAARLGSRQPVAPGCNYAENAAANPEDPTLGAFSLNLPAGSGNFSGSMFFTYVGCQTSNVGTVAGAKSLASLTGTWTGTIDGSAQAGTYSGTFGTGTQSYSGVYANTGGKQFIDREPCISYHIGPHGTWEMFPIEANVPASFRVTVSGRAINFPVVAGAQSTLVYVLDPAVATAGGNPVVWQTLLVGGTSVTVPSSVSLASGRSYVAVVGVGNADNQRVAFGSRRFTAP